MADVPRFVTHYHLADRAPFLNLSELSDPELTAVLAELDARRQRGSHRVFGPRYMELRRLTEARLRRLFADAGGAPERTSPHYFVLGASAWYLGLAPDTQDGRRRCGVRSFGLLRHLDVERGKRATSVHAERRHQASAGDLQLRGRC